MSEDHKLEAAKFAILNGLEASVERYSLSKSEIVSMLTPEIGLLQRAKSLIQESAERRGVRGASEEWGLSEELIESLLAEPIGLVSQKSIQTDPRGFKRFASKSSITRDEDLEEEGFIPPVPRKVPKTSEEKRMTAKYTNSQKIEAVREFVKYNNQSEAARELKIPAVNLMRWRDMIKNEVFQDNHCDVLYKSNKQGQRTKFFREIDESIFVWVCNNPGGDIVNKARETAKLDECEPIVSQEWVDCFKEYYKLNKTR